MLQNMPSAEYIAKALGIDQSGVESLLVGNQQGKSYLAQQLTQRGALPGATLTQSTVPLPGISQDPQRIKANALTRSACL